MVNDGSGGNEQGGASVIRSFRITDLGTPRYYDAGALNRTMTATPTSMGLEMNSAIISAGILSPGESLLSPDSYAYVVLPLPPDSKPGTEREYIPAVARTTTDSLGSQLARVIMTETDKQIEAWEQKGVNWRWITIEAPTTKPSPAIQELFSQHHVNYKQGEGLRFLAYGGEPRAPLPKAQLPTGNK